jgi:hypothetical protein
MTIFFLARAARLLADHDCFWSLTGRIRVAYTVCSRVYGVASILLPR